MSAERDIRERALPHIASLMWATTGYRAAEADASGARRREACGERGGCARAAGAGAEPVSAGWASEALGPKITRCGLRSKLRIARPRSANVRRASTASASY